MSDSKLKRWVDVCQIAAAIVVVATAVGVGVQHFEAQAAEVRQSQQAIFELYSKLNAFIDSQEAANNEFRSRLERGDRERQEILDFLRQQTERQNANGNNSQ